MSRLRTASSARRLAVAALVLLPLVAYWPAVSTPAVGYFHDDGLYLVTAGALAQGRGYTIESLPSAVAQTKYPVVFPALLAAAWRLSPSFPGNIQMLRIVPFLAALIWVGVVYRVIRRDTERTDVAALVVFLTLASPWVLFLSSVFLSETTFAALAWTALLFMQRCESANGGQKWVLLAALFTALATLTRIPGVCLAAAFLATLALRGRWRSVALYAVAVLLLVAPWFLWAGSQAVPSNLGYYSSSNYLDWITLVDPRWSDLLGVLAGNARYLLISPGNMVGLFYKSLDTGTIFVALLISALVLVGLVADVRKGLTVLSAFAVVYGLVLFVWPWLPARFVAPFYPLVLLFGWKGLLLVLGLVRNRRAARYVSGAAIAALASVSLVSLVSASRLAAYTGTVWPHPACNGNWSEFEAIFRWIDANTRPDVILAGNLDPLLYLYTGRRAVRAFEADPVALYDSSERSREPLGPPADLANRLSAAGADYLITMPGACFHEKDFLELQIAALLEQDDPVLVEVAEYSEDSRIYKVRHPR